MENIVQKNTNNSGPFPFIYKDWITDTSNKYRWIWAEEAINTEKYSEIKEEAEKKMINVLSKLNEDSKEGKAVLTQLNDLIKYYKTKEEEFYKIIKLPMEKVVNPISVLTKYFFMNINNKEKLTDNKNDIDTIDFNEITEPETCFKLVVADRNFSNKAQQYLTGSMFSRASFYSAREGLFGKLINEINEEKDSKKRKKKIAKGIEENKEIRKQILQDLIDVLQISLTKKESEKAEEIINLNDFDNFKSALKTFGEELNKTGSTLDIKSGDGKIVYMTIASSGQGSDIISGLRKTLNDIYNNLKKSDIITLDLMGAGKYKAINFDKGIEKALKFLNNNINLINQVSYSKGAKSGVSGFIGELLGFLNFNKSNIKISHSGTEADTVNLSEYASNDKKGKYKKYGLGSSFADEKVEVEGMNFGINIKHYISKQNKNEYFHIYKPSEVSLFDNQAIYRYFSKEAVFLMRFAYLNYSFYQKISGSTQDFFSEFKQDVKNFSVISIGNFIRLSSPEELNLFYQINNLVIPASMILQQMYNKIQKDMNNDNGYSYFDITVTNEEFPEPLNKGKMTFNQFKKEAKNSLLISQRPKKLAIKYRGLEINLSDLKFR